MDKLDAHVMLWLLIAFVAGTLWTPMVDLAASHFTADNDYEWSEEYTMPPCPDGAPEQLCEEAWKKLTDNQEAR